MTTRDDPRVVRTRALWARALSRTPEEPPAEFTQEDLRDLVRFGFCAEVQLPIIRHWLTQETESARLKRMIREARNGK